MKQYLTENLLHLWHFVWSKLEIEAAVICFWSMSAFIAHAENLLWSVFVGVIVLYIKTLLTRRWPKFFDYTKSNKNKPDANP